MLETYFDKYYILLDAEKEWKRRYKYESDEYKYDDLFEREESFDKKGSIDEKSSDLPPNSVLQGDEVKEGKCQKNQLQINY